MRGAEVERVTFRDSTALALVVRFKTPTVIVLPVRFARKETEAIRCQRPVAATQRAALPIRVPPASSRTCRHSVPPGRLERTMPCAL